MVLAPAGQVLPASSAPLRTGGPSASHTAPVASPNLGAEQLPLWENLDPRLWQLALEGGDPSCRMSKNDIDSILPGVQEPTAELGPSARADHQGHAHSLGSAHRHAQDRPGPDGRPLTAQEPYALAPTRITRDDPQSDVHRRARAKPLLNSRWSEAAKNPRPDTTPVTYTVTAVTLTGIQRYRDKVVLTASQDGRERDATCRVITGPDAGGESVRCELEEDDRIVVSEGRPALIAIDFNHLLYGSDPKDDGAWSCDETAGPCVPQNSQNPRKYGSVISVESPDDKQRYDVPVQLGYGIVRGLPADKVERLE
ncbi:hypothetical protein [Streptomyces roseolus]|uniref:hypothetical protein n=1 Tax=Streptomyces roseolus TaxID=67358 RepID=UPI003654AC3F